MNHSIIKYILGFVLQFEAAFMLLPCAVSVIYHETSGLSFLIVAVAAFITGKIITLKKPDNMVFYAKEGFIVVALSWIIMSIIGALPLIMCGEVPNFTNALFEITSGFTTTGASVINDVEALSHTVLFWRSFTHWIGGMGVFVFILAVLPMTGGNSMHLMRAESPGPSVGKLVPRLRDTALILYGIYFSMTVIEIILLVLAGMPVFDALTSSFGTAGTGGFGIKNNSIQGYSIAIQNIITVFMILFGVNFNAYYFLLGKKKSNAFKMEELHWYFGIIALSVIIITMNTRAHYTSIYSSFQSAAFQVASIITTTGFSTVNFDLWPELSKSIMILLMFIGACAGSTGGGIKVSRILILLKSVRKEISRFIHPRSVKRIKLDGKALDSSIVHGVNIFLITYMLVFIFSVFLVAFDNLDLITNFTSVAATLNNIGPGLELVGPTMNFSVFSPFAKYVLIFDMLAGRLELYPLLLLFTPSVWRKN